MKTRVCAFCIALMRRPSSNLKIDTAPDAEPEELYRILNVIQRSDPVATIEEIKKAFLENRQVMLDNIIITPVLTVWEGTPVCAPHLQECYDRWHEPSTVRMAQWKR